jgi:hypothetical protein
MTTPSRGNWHGMSVSGIVSRVTPVQTALRNCTRDEGRSFEFGNQVLISSHRKLLSSKAMVVNVAEKSEQDFDRDGWETCVSSHAPAQNRTCGFPAYCCTENSDSAILVMKAAQNRLRCNDSEALNRAMQWRILAQRAMNARPII